MTPVLKTCPFCGGDVKIMGPNDAGDYWISVSIEHTGPTECDVQMSREGRWNPHRDRTGIDPVVEKKRLEEHLTRSLAHQWNQRSGAFDITFSVAFPSRGSSPS